VRLAEREKPEQCVDKHNVGGKRLLALPGVAKSEVRALTEQREWPDVVPVVCSAIDDFGPRCTESRILRMRNFAAGSGGVDDSTLPPVTR
jgi:hypothetical protein